MKTTPDNLRKLAFILERCDNPNAVTALRWAADDIEDLQRQVRLLEERISYLRDTLKSLGDRHTIY
jgi:hypothetical protein